MSDTMEGDENMIVLVVGDEDSSKDDPLSNVKIDSVFSVNETDPAQMPYPVTLKIEPLDGSTTYDTENISVKEEQDTDEYEVEFLEDEYEQGVGDAKADEDHTSACHESDQDYKVENDDEEDDDEDEDDQDESSDSEYQKTSRKKRTTKGKGPPRNTRKRKTGQKKEPQKKPKLNIHKREKLTKTVSYVQQLRDENPEMDEDEEKLIKHLATLMRDTVPPTPPENYCTVIMNDEEDKKKYKCSFCAYQSATTEAAAARHYQYKHGPYYLKCYSCGYAHKDTPTLYKHERRCRAPDAELVLRARGLYLGRKGRSRPFFVNTKFVTRNTFVKQKGSNEDENRRFHCSMCTATFAHRDNLKSHENQHKGLRPHRCSHCPASYASYAQYKRHMNLHGDYQYVCDHCGKKFRLRPALVSHLETHQPRKYACTSCGRRFAGRIACDHHMKTVHLNQPAAHGCPVCPKRYAKMSHVKEHMSRKHGLTMMTAKMFCRAMPKLTDEEIERTRKLFRFDMNSTVSTKNVIIREPEHILPHLSESDQQESPTLTKIVKIIKKKNAKSVEVRDPEKVYYHDSEDVGDPGDVSHDLENVDHDLEDVSYDLEYEDHDLEDIAQEPEETDYEQEDYPVEYIEEIEELEEKQEEEKEEKLQPKKKKRPRRLKIGSPVKIDEEIEDEAMYNIEYKRKRKTANLTTETKNTDEKVYEIVRNIKSTLTNRKKISTQAEKKKPGFYEIKREFLDQLKNEIEIPKSKEKKPKNVVTKMQSEKIVPGTEIPEDLVPWTKTTENVTPQKVIVESEKNKAVIDFFKYVKTGVVLKRVPILRRGEEKI